MTLTKSIQICSLSFLLILGSCGKKNTNEEKTISIRPVKSVQIETSSNSLVGNYPARTAANRIVDLAFRLPGTLDKLYATEGKSFKKGEVIAQLDQRDFIINLKEKEAIYSQKKSELERYKRLLDKGSIPLNDYELKDTDYQRALSAYENAKNDLKDTKLIAPFDGSIGRLFVENFQEVSANKSIVNLVDLSAIEVEFFVPESQLFDTKDIKTFEITFDAAPERTFTASLKEISRVAQPQGFPVSLILNDFVLENPEYIKQATSVGFTVRVNMVYNDDIKNDKIVVPVGAIFEDAKTKKNAVWVLDRESMTVSMRFITTGNFVSDEAIEAIKGLNPGEWIVIAGKYQISEGQKVKDLPNKL